MSLDLLSDTMRSLARLQFLQIGGTLNRTANLSCVKETQLLVLGPEFLHIGVNKILNLVRIDLTRPTVADLQFILNEYAYTLYNCND